MTVSHFAIRVAPQTEFRVLHALNQMERPALVPFEEVPTPRPNKPHLNRWKKLALFPGYVFATFPGTINEAWVDFTSVRRAVNSRSEAVGKVAPIIGLIGYGSRPATLSGDQVEFLTGLSREGVEVVTEPFKIGQTVKLTDWVIPGTTGRIEAINRQRVSVLLEFFGGMRVVEMQLSAIEAA